MSQKNVFFFKRFILPCFIFLFLLSVCLFPIKANASEHEILYTIRLKRLHPDVRSSILRFAEITDSVTKSSIGKIESVSFTPHTKENYSPLYDRIVEAPHPYFYDAVITVKSIGEAQKNAYRIGIFKLFVGAPIHFFTADFSGSGECTEIFPVEAQS